MLDLPKQSGYPSRVPRSTAGQIRRDDLTCIGIDSEVQLPPSPSLRRFPQVADVNPESRTIDEQEETAIEDLMPHHRDVRLS